MKAAVVQGPGKVPAYAEFADPIAEPGEILIHVAASGVSHLARGRASGAHYSASNAYPFIPGVDGVGRTEAGERVYFLMPRAPYGALAEWTTVPKRQCLPVPDGLDDATAAAIVNPGMSAWAALAERAKLQAGETVLVNGATGAAGRLAVQIAKYLGAGKVIATGRNAEALASLKALGADKAIRLDEDDEALEAAFRPHLAEGVDVVVDYLWGRSAEQLMIAAAKSAPEARAIRYVEVGSVSGQEITLPSAALRACGIQLMGSGLGSVGGPRLLASIAKVLQAAVPAGLKIATRLAPLSEVESQWAAGDDARRLVFTPA